MKNKNILYLLGSGRSGTTLIATVLNSTKQIKTLGELHQFYSYACNDKLCSCGETISNCEYWSAIFKKMNTEHKRLKEIEVKQNYEEKHKFIPNLSIIDLLFNKGPDAKSYLLHLKDQL